MSHLPVSTYLAAQQGDLAARDRIIEAHMNVVRYHAKRAARRHLPPEFQELVNVGVIAMVTCIPAYKPELSAFATYASQWIRAAVARECYLARRPVQGTQKEWRRASKNVDAPSISPGERERMRVLLAAQQMPERLDEIRWDEHGCECEPMVAMLPAIDGSPLKALQNYRNAQALHEAIQRLQPRLREIVRRRLDDPSMTLADLGRQMGVSRERVRQLEARAHATLKFELEAKLER